MRHLATKVLVATVGLALAAAPMQAQEQPRKRGDQSKLTRLELDEGGASISTALDAVRLLRHRWLNPSPGRVVSSNMLGSGGGSQAVIVYVDDVRQPDVESLRRVKGADIVEMRYLDQNRAVQMRGPGHEAGVIEVITVNKRK